MITAPRGQFLFLATPLVNTFQQQQPESELVCLPASWAGVQPSRSPLLWSGARASAPCW